MHELSYEVAPVTFIKTIEKSAHPKNFAKNDFSLKTVL